jgi:hypothetical protein
MLRRCLIVDQLRPADRQLSNKHTNFNFQVEKRKNDEKGTALHNNNWNDKNQTMTDIKY